MTGTLDLAQSKVTRKKPPLAKFVGEYNAMRLKMRAELHIHHSTAYDFDHLKRTIRENYPEYEPYLYDFLCDLGEAMALADLVECDINGRGEFLNRNDAIWILKRDYIFVSDPNSNADRTVQTQNTAEKYVTNFELESMKAAEDDHALFGDDLGEDLPLEYKAKLSQMERKLCKAVWMRYHNGAFRGVSETFVGWDEVRDQLYARRPTWRRKLILTALRRLRIHGTYGAENGLLLPWVKRRQRVEHRRRAQIELFTVKTDKPWTARPKPAGTSSMIPQADLSPPLNTQPSTSLAEISNDCSTSEAKVAVEPMHTDTEKNDGDATERSSHGLSPPESSEQPAGLLTPPQDGASTSPLQASSPSQMEMSHWIHDMYHRVGFSNSNNNFVGWKKFLAQLLTMKPAVEHAQLKSELARLRKPGHAESLPNSQEIESAMAKARRQNRTVQHDPPRTSAPLLPNPQAVSSSISTSHAQTPHDIGSTSSVPGPSASAQPEATSNPPDFNRFSLLLKKGRNGGKANIIERDIRQGPLLSGEIVEKFSKSLVPQYGLLGSLTGEDVSSPSSQIFSNPSTPFSAFICGVQGSGKSHTTACLLENSMICSENIGRLHGSVSSLVFSYGSSDGNNISEVAYLGASKPGFDNHHAKKVTVLVSPSNKAIGKRYEELPNVKAIPFYLNAKTLTIHAMTMLMAFDEKAVKPMYMAIVESVLRDMATKSLSDNAPLDYADFKSRLKNEGLDAKQKKALENRLKVLETFLDLTGKFPQPQYAPGEITIMDLSDNQLSSTTACILFKLGLENFLKSSATGKMVVLDEAHKYMGDTPGAKFFSDGLGRAIREMRHEGLRVIISTQEPTVANELIALCSVTIIHRFSSPTWYSALKKHISAMDEEQSIMRQIEELSTGEALVYAPTAVLKENDDGSLVKATGQFLKIDVRDRVTEDGGESRLAA
ncbi:hypothetical protein P3342_008446 [Pyrenophora teres f. teres]|uniref:Uncharacterized protein n=1 Tax=Pyrenophora teres f. teres TaxID=97479 RepID=A0A6S6W8Z6_9PLEO|nr:hypothetical protein PTNB85_07167 [Pyrenophora teres f. teres]KAE8857419.1 hypothetical protein PTNB29_08486 [Pyrenophora teres f. teres]KAK1910567.1 hypothetical protein P3342_008446 [Pyrenophora teres f. teres]CAE7185837.1 hypothetical protein PTTW11_06873 [Pyrenophora teres f. teres]